MKNVFKVLTKPKGRPIILKEDEEAALYKFLEYDSRDSEYSRKEVQEFTVSMRRVRDLLKDKFV